MISFFNDEYFITSDSRQFKIVQKYYDSTQDKTTLKPVGYYHTFEGACKALFRIKYRSADYKTAQELLKAIEEARDEITRVIREAGITESL